jgi:hypothetical protein
MDADAISGRYGPDQRSGPHHSSCCQLRVSSGRGPLSSHSRNHRFRWFGATIRVHRQNTFPICASKMGDHGWGGNQRHSTDTRVTAPVINHRINTHRGQARASGVRPLLPHASCPPLSRRVPLVSVPSNTPTAEARGRSHPGAVFRHSRFFLHANGGRHAGSTEPAHRRVGPGLTVEEGFSSSTSEARSLQCPRG